SHAVGEAALVDGAPPEPRRDDAAAAKLGEPLVGIARARRRRGRESKPTAPPAVKGDAVTELTSRVVGKKARYDAARSGVGVTSERDDLSERPVHDARSDALARRRLLLRRLVLVARVIVVVIVLVRGGLPASLRLLLRLLGLGRPLDHRHRR